MAGGMRPITLPNGFLAPSYGSARVGFRSGVATVIFAYVNDRFRIVEIACRAAQLDGVESDDVDFDELLDTAITLNVKPPMSEEQWWNQPVGPVGSLDELTPGGLTAVRNARRKRVMTSDFLREVAALAETATAEEIATKYSVTDRTVRRWLQDYRSRASTKRNGRH